MPLCFSERKNDYFSIQHSLIAFKIERRCVYCAVRNETLYTTAVNRSLKGLSLLSVVGIKRRLEILFLVQCQIEPHNLNINTQFAAIYINIQGVPGGMDKTSGECSLC